jgi:hypothetical protein
MLPRHHYDKSDNQGFNDSEWISGQIDKLPISKQKDTAQRYSDIYLKLTTEKDKKARFKANGWLRKTVDKNKAIDTGGYF